MGRQLIVTAAEVAAGWVVRPDPADLLAAAAPCETCRGRRTVRVREVWNGDDREPCPDCRITLIGECPECLEGCDISTCCECGEDYTEPCPRHVAAGHVASADPYDDGSECDSCCQRCHGAWRTVTFGHAYAVGGVEMRDDSHYMLRLEVVQ